MNEIKLPQLGQSVEEASIVTWLKQEGDAVETGDILFTVQTDKAEIEVESTAAGVLRKILVQPDEIIPVMTVVALVGDADEALPDLSQYAVDGAAPPAAESAPAESPSPTPSPAPSSAAPSSAPAAPAGPNGGNGGAISPRARQRAKERQVNASVLTGSGVGGRVMAADVDAYADAVEAIPMTPTARRIAAKEGLDVRRMEGTGPQGRITKEDALRAVEHKDAAAPPPMEGRRTPLSPMRRIIAERMASSKYSAPHYYVTVEVDMAACVTYRKESTAFKPSFNDIVMFQTVKALRDFPAVNARWCGDAIEEVGAVNLGFAVALPTGLIVPVVQNAHALTLQQLNAETAKLTEKARTNRLLPDDYAGSTFTVSNLGGFGVDNFTAIINQPDSAILAVGAIKDRPVAIEGGIHVRPIMKLTLSSDHRVIDGALAAQFMGHLKSLLEEPVF